MTPKEALKYGTCIGAINSITNNTEMRIVHFSARPICTVNLYNDIATNTSQQCQGK